MLQGTDVATIDNDRTGAIGEYLYRLSLVVADQLVMIDQLADFPFRQVAYVPVAHRQRLAG
jgi:hypothetical protein